MSIVNETCIFTYDYRQKEDVFVLIITHFVKGRVFSNPTMTDHYCFRKWTRFCGESCVLSSAKDMANFMLFLLGNGTIPGAMLPILETDNLHNIYKPWNRIQSPSVDDYFSKAEGVPISRSHTGVGLGFKTGMYRGEYICTHSCSFLLLIKMILSSLKWFKCHKLYFIIYFAMFM